MVAALKPTILTFLSAIPGGTFCDNCGRLRQAHVDDVCVAKPVRSRKALAAEDVHAQRDALAAALRDVLKFCVSDTAHMFAEPQEALANARALLVEVGL
jgi:protein tyrosine phosphatase (PTP) superfamily phosphohydrolase (DUF442 family)